MAWELISPPRKVDPETDPKKIIIMKFWGMGTILLASSSIRNIKKKYPSSEITLLTLLMNKELCSILSVFDKRLYLEIGTPLKFLLSYLRVLYIVRKHGYDTVIDLEFITNFSALTTILITIFSKPKRIIGFNSPVKWRNLIYSFTVSFDHSRHISMIFSKMFAILHLDSNSTSFEKEREDLLRAADTKFFRDYSGLNDLEKESRRLISVNINAGALSHLRRWPRENFAYIIKNLVEGHLDVSLVLIGSKEDTSYVQGLFSQFPKTDRIFNLCGQLSIRQLIGLFSKSSFLISNDSGPLHIAAALGLPTISFFGPETPYLYGPQGSHHSVFYSDVFCSPCLNIYNSKLRDCQENVCLQKISSASVLKVIEEKFLNLTHSDFQKTSKL